MSKNYTNAIIAQRRNQQAAQELLKEPAIRRAISEELKPILKEMQVRFFDGELACICYSMLESGLSVRTVRRWILHHRKAMDDFGNKYLDDIADLDKRDKELPETIKVWFKLHDIDYDKLIEE